MAQASKVGGGRLVVTAAATRSNLIGSAGTAAYDDPAGPIKTVAIQALEGNTTKVAVSGASVVALAGATQRGVLLAAGSVISIDTDDLADVYVDVRTSGEGVTFVWNA